MRPAKLSKAQLLSHCAVVFKQHGYHGSSMQMLAAACGLSKGAFYYHYTNKEDLLRDLLDQVHRQLKASIFPLATQPNLSLSQRFEQMHQAAIALFTHGESGCLMAIISIDALYTMPTVLPTIQLFFQDWQHCMLQLYSERYPQRQATALAKQSIADYEGAILMYRLTQDLDYIELLKQRILSQLTALPQLSTP